MPLTALYTGSGPVFYLDLRFRFLISLFVANYLVVYGEPESMVQLLQMPYYYYSILGSLISTVIICELTYICTKLLDCYYTWVKNWVLRGLLQVLLCIILPLGLTFLMIGYYFEYFGVKSDLTTYLRYDFPIVTCFIVILNAYYFITYLVKFKFQIIKKNLPNEFPKKPNAIDANTIAVIYANEKICLVLTFNNEILTWPKNIKESIAELSDLDYFQISRSEILHFSCIGHYKAHPSNTLLVTLKAPLKLDRKLIVSQRRIVKFKEWYVLRTDVG